MPGVSTNQIDCGDGAIVGDNVLPAGRNQPAGDSFGSGRSNFVPIQIDEIAAYAVAWLVPVDGDSLSVRHKMRGATVYAFQARHGTRTGFAGTDRVKRYSPRAPGQNCDCPFAVRGKAACVPVSQLYGWGSVQCE